MSSKVAPPKNTGGGGFVFEDDVCAWLLASMLVGEPVFGVDCGPPVRLDFQTRPDGWFLDDVLVTTAVGPTHHRFAISVKSNAQFTAISAPSDFVAVAWEQWLHIGSATFDAALDFMGLVTAPLSGAATSAVTGLGEKARVNDPILFPSRLETPNWATADERSLFASFACPPSLGQATTDVDTARLLQRLRFVQRDFGNVASESQNGALELCRRAVRSQTSIDAQVLWSILREVASELRPQAGTLDLNGLIERLRSRVMLAAYPEHAGDWATLDARSAREVGLVRNSIADRVRLPRDPEVLGLIDAIAADAQVALLGSSGVGKSALARAVLERRLVDAGRTLWIDTSSLDRAADFGAFEASLQLRHPLNDLLAMETSRDPVVIIDGLDRLYAEHAFRNVASLLRAAAGGERKSTRWRVLAVCQSQEWPRVLEALQRAGAPVTRWRTHEATALRTADLQPVRDAFPALARLLLHPRVGALLTTLKLLDLVVRRLDGGTDIDASAWVGESSVAEWFWSAEVSRGADRLARGQFARNLAQAQADQITVSISIDTLDASTLNAAQSLTADQLLLQMSGDRLAFAHDLYGDWVRLRILLNHRSDLATYLQGRHESPLWHRAIRLLGIHLLERENGVAEWKMLMSSFDSGNLTIVRDLLLEAPAFAMNAGPLLESIFTDLVAGDGVLFQRLLTRFLAFATVPNEQMQEIARSVGLDANVARTSFRQPHWPYWLDVLAVLYAHRDEVLRVAPTEVAKVVEMWLEFVPPGSVRRREAAELAILLGQIAVDTRDEYGDREDSERFYKCALLASPERPDEVTHLSRTAAERIPRPKSSEDKPVELQARPRSMFSTGVMRGPWSDGPLARVDESFQSVVLDTSAIRHLFRVRPAAAREVILATLIDPPHEESWGSSGLHERRDLDLQSRHKWHPALYTQGPFLVCLRENFGEGLELIMQLVDFATERDGEYSEQSRREWRARAIASGRAEADVDLEVSAVREHRLALLGDDSKILTFAGDAGVYGWSSGHGNPPKAIVAALMALEQYFYLRLDKGEDIADDISAVVTRSRSVALLGVLCDIGKRQPVLFDGPLRFLLSAPELYSWDISKNVGQRSHLMIGAQMQGQQFLELARQFHGMEHRRHDLRRVATQRMLNSGEMKSFFASVRDWWEKRRAQDEQLDEIAEQLELLFNPANYHHRENPKHGTVLINVALEQVQMERAIEHQEMTERMLVMNLPFRCRTILDDRRVLTEPELDELWQTCMRMRKLAEDGTSLPGGEKRFGDEYANAIAGCITVLLWHDDWLRRDANRRTAIEGALQLLTDTDLSSPGEFRSEHDVSTWTWDCFVAESVALLLMREPQNKQWRRLVAEFVFAEKYATVRMLFSRCAEHRVTLGEDFERLRRLVIDWAHVKERVEALHSLRHSDPPFDEQVRERLLGEAVSWREQAITSFVDGTAANLSIEWDQFDKASCFEELDALRRRWAGYRPLDFHLVRCSHQWMPLPDEAQTIDERDRIIHFWKIALDVVTARPRANLQRRDGQYPNEDEVWVLANLATALLQMQPNDKVQQLWETVIDLHSEAHDWPEQFLTSLHRRALSAESTPETYAPLLLEIAQRALSEIDGKPRWPWHEEVWDALIGIDYRVSDLWSSRHAQHVLRTWDVISLWMDKAPQTGRRLGKFARWLSTPAGTSIRLRVLPWFVAQLQPEKQRTMHRSDDVQDDLAKLLNTVWDQDQLQLRASSESFSAFRGLLAWLVECQNSFGLELQGRIGGL